MTDNVDVKIARIQYEVDTSSVKKAEQANDNLGRSFQHLDGSTVKLGRSQERIADQLNRHGRRLAQNVKTSRLAKKISDAQAKSFDNQAKKVIKLTSTLEELDRANSAVRGQVGALGDVGGAARTIGGAAGALGNEELERTVAILAEIPDTFEAIPQLVASFPAAFAAAQVALTGTTFAVGTLTFSLGILLLPLAAAAVSLAIVAKQVKKHREELDRSFEALRTEAEAKQQTTSEIKASIEALEMRRDAEIEVQKRLQSGADATGWFGKAITGVGKELKEQTETVKDTRSELNALNAALESSSVAANDLAEEEMRLSDARVVAAQRDAEFQVKAEAATKEQLAAQLKAMEQQRLVIKRQIDTLKDSDDNSQIVTDRLAELNEELLQLGKNTRFVIEASKTAASGKEDEADATEELSDALKEAEKAQEKQAEVVARTQEKIIAETERGAEQREKLALKTAQRLEDLATKTAQSAEDALRKLEQKQADARLGLRRDFADNDRQRLIDEQQGQIEFQRNEVETARQHAETLRRIRVESQRSEEDLIRNRDFAGLARLRRDTGRKLTDESKSFNDGRKERLREFKQEAVDNRNAFILQREQRILEFSRQLQDIQTQARREAQQQRINTIRREQEIARAFNRELTALNKANSAKLTMLGALLQAELDLVASATNAVSKAKKKVDSQPKKTDEGTVITPPKVGGGAGGSTIKPPPIALAGGGRLRRGQIATVNELGTETFTPDGGRPFRLPDGRGQFRPSRSGRVNPAGGGNQILVSIPLTVTVNDRNDILREATRQLEQVLRGL